MSMALHSSLIFKSTLFFIPHEMTLVQPLFCIKLRSDHANMSILWQVLTRQLDRKVTLKSTDAELTNSPSHFFCLEFLRSRLLHLLLYLIANIGLDTFATAQYHLTIQLACLPKNQSQSACRSRRPLGPSEFASLPPSTAIASRPRLSSKKRTSMSALQSASSSSTPRKPASYHGGRGISESGPQTSRSPLLDSSCCNAPISHPTTPVSGNSLAAVPSSPTLRFYIRW